MKKFSAILLSIVLILSLSISTLAENTEPAAITGMSITVDGVTYTEGQTAVITPQTTSISVHVHGVNLQNSTDDHCANVSPHYYAPLSTSYWDISEDGSTATADVSRLLFEYKRLNLYELVYSNNGGETWIDSGVYVIYEDGVAEEDRAVITGMSVTVDGVTYTKGQIAVITDDTESVSITVIGNNLQNATVNNSVSVSAGYFAYLTSSLWTLSPDGTTATVDMSNYLSLYTNTSAAELWYSNDDKDTTTGSGVSVIYLSEPDTEPPIISGIENGKTYYTTQEVTVTDKNIDKITLNGEEATDTITLEGNKEATYTIIATDKAGLKTTVTVTMKPVSAIGSPIDNINEDTVKATDKATIQNIIEQVDDLLTNDGLIEAEKTALEEIKEKAEKLIKKLEEIAKAIENDIVSENVNSEDKTALTNTSTALSEQGKPAASTSPQTGDNLNLTLWVALLFIGGAISATAFTIKKRKIKA